MTIPCPIATASRTIPNRPAVVAGDASLSYSDLSNRIDAAVTSLERLGIASGDRVGIHLAAEPDLPVLLWALFRLRATAVLLSDRDPERRTVENAVATGCRLIASNASIEGLTPIFRPSKLFTGHAPITKDRSTDLSLKSIATIIFTSGSQARPKATVHRLAGHWYSAKGSQTNIEVAAETRWGLLIPTYHVGGLSIFFRCFLHGGTVVIVDRQSRHPQGLSALGVTHVSIVPTQLTDWIARDDRSLLTGLNTILVGGAPTPTGIRKEALEARLPVRFTYGSTEMASQVATTGPGDTDLTPGYAGRVLPHREVRIRDEEILVRGETRFAGYWQDGVIEQPFDEGGWFPTGDVGRLDDDRLFVTGRRDNQFTSGGENVYPEEIEEAIVTAGFAKIAIVVPVEDERFGARPVAYVEPMCSLEALNEALGRVLPAHKLPGEVRQLPQGMNGSKRDRLRLTRLFNT